MKAKYIFLYVLLLLPYLLSSTPRWKINLKIKVNGIYEIKEISCLIKGEYHLITEWEGVIEKDNSDFLLYHGNEKIIKWRGKEIILNLKDSSKKIIDLSKHSPPKLKVNYLLRENNSVNLDFNFSSIFIPGIKEKRKLLMPRSAQNEFLNPKIKYNKNIIEGTNHIRFKNKEIYNKKFMRTYSWKWKKTEMVCKKNNILPFKNFHSVIVQLEIKPLSKL